MDNAAAKEVNYDIADVDKAWAYGYKAAQLGRPEKANPFPNYSNLYFLWIEGWWEGFYS